MLSSSALPKRNTQSLPTRIYAYIKTAAFQCLLVIIIGTLVASFVFTGSLSPARYNLAAGMVPYVTIAATRDVVDEITTEHNRRLAASAVTPTYRFQEGVTVQVTSKLDEIYLQLSAVRQYAQNLPEYSANRRYTDEELAYAAGILTLADLQDFQLVTLMNSQQEHFDELLTSLRAAVRNTMQGHVTQGQENTAITSIMQVVGFRTNVSLLQNVVLPTLRAVILPNMIIDTVQTDAAKQAAMLAVEPVLFKQGQNIVVKGEGRVRANQLAMLENLGLLSLSQRDYGLFLGAMITSLMTLSVMIVLLRVALPSFVSNRRHLAVLYLVILGSILLTFAAKSLQSATLAPLVLAPMLLTLLLGFVPALITHAALSILTALIVGGSAGALGTDAVLAYSTSLLAGTAASLLLNRRGSRSSVMLAGSLAGMVSFLGVWGLGTLFNRGGTLWTQALMAAGGAGISTILCFALQPLLETAFNLPTNNRLMELSNPNHPLLRRLLLETPGTYHHSILIANMAETAAEAVGANPLLARVGGYYHDIGKLKRPLYFKENQMGQSNIHDNTDPAVSAAIITSHVRDGLVLARQYRLPLELQQIVAHHHGNSRVAYFYSKALKDGSTTVEEENFRYEGTPPQSVETAIVMICDTVEAAVRSMSNPSKEEIAVFIQKLIRAKLDDGQLANAPLTVKDLSAIGAACTTVVHGIFHERIEYPEDDRHGAFARLKNVARAIPAGTAAQKADLDTLS